MGEKKKKKQNTTRFTPKQGFIVLWDGNSVLEDKWTLFVMMWKREGALRAVDGGRTILNTYETSINRAFIGPRWKWHILQLRILGGQETKSVIFQSTEHLSFQVLFIFLLYRRVKMN